MKRIVLCCGLTGVLLPFPALAQTPSAPGCAPPVRAFSIQMARDPSGLNWVPVNINGAQKYFMLDIGSERTTVFIEAANDLKLPITNLAGNGFIFDYYGFKSSKTVAPALLTVGPFKSENGTFFLSPRGNTLYARDRLMAGRLGRGLLAGQDVELDSGRAALHIVPVTHCAGMTTFAPGDTAGSVPFTINGMGDIEVAAKIDGVDVTAVIAPGMPVTTMNETFAEETLKLDLDARDVQEVEVSGVDGHRKTFRNIELAGLTFANPVLDILPDRITKAIKSTTSTSSGFSTGGVSGTLSSYTKIVAPPGTRLPDLVIGTDILNRLRLFISNAEKKIYFAPPSPPPPAQGAAPR